MKLSDPQLLELNELCNALIDGALSAAQRARLERVLADSEEARRFYVRTMALSASLFDYASEMQVEAPDAPLNESPARGLWWAIGSLAAAALVLVAFWFDSAARRQEAAIAGQETDDSVARLTGAKDCQWIGAAFSSGDELRRGQLLQLASGLAEVTFDSGAQVVLEGPASLELTSAWEALLPRGTLRANVPPEAIGFRVSNAAVEVVDLGTEFSMVADERGATEVFVLKGRVEAKETGDRTPVVLQETQARRFAGPGSSEVRDREQKLRKLSRKIAFERFARPAGYVHWSFDEPGGNTAAAEIIGPGPDGLIASIEATPELLANSRVEGRFQRALRLNGQLFAKADATGWSESGARTVAFWVNIAVDAQLPDAGAMLAFSMPGNPARRCEVIWNRQPEQGPLGALRTNVGRGFTIGSTPLRDGRWHHLAVVFTPAPRSPAKLQVKQYVDGRLEGMAARRPIKRRGNDTQTADHWLWIGRSSAERSDRFRGAIDELFIADRALAPLEIKQLIEHNKPAPAGVIAAE
ncbi:MAG: hypothetical protein QOE70_5865 [Chthoniobacter sp.]|nr:hypothetical protein [Chthoniobacter sp.]